VRPPPRPAPAPTTAKRPADAPPAARADSRKTDGSIPIHPLGGGGGGGGEKGGTFGANQEARYYQQQQRQEFLLLQQARLGLPDIARLVIETRSAPKILPALSPTRAYNLRHCQTRQRHTFESCVLLI
jgi:hypothetical protein